MATTTAPNIQITPEMDAFLKKASNTFLFNFFMIAKLPSAYISGVRLREINYEKAVVSVPFKWLSQNPFRSTYFACLAMAAEMSTGVLAIMATQGQSVSMLVVDLQSEFVKKAVGRTYFTCDQGHELIAQVQKAKVTGEPTTFRAESIGRDKDGNEIAKFWITWSFKARKSS